MSVVLKLSKKSTFNESDVLSEEDIKQHIGEDRFHALENAIAADGASKSEIMYLISCAIKNDDEEASLYFD